MKEAATVRIHITQRFPFPYRHNTHIIN